MQKRRIASWKQNLEYINILQESCKIVTFTEIESLQGPTTLYRRLLPNNQYFYIYRLPVKIPATSQMCVNMAESDRQHASTMESLEESDTASLDLSCELSIFDEEDEIQMKILG